MQAVSYTQAYICMHTHACALTHTHTCTHTHTHTYKPLAHMTDMNSTHYVPLIMTAITSSHESWEPADNWL